MTVAGHTFDLSGRCGDVVRREDGTYRICGRKWLDIMHVDQTCEGMLGYAHIAGINKREFEEVRIEREERARVAHQATHSVVAGGWRAPNPIQVGEAEG